MAIRYEQVLEFFFWGLDVLSRRDCGLVLAGLRVCESERRANQLLSRLEQQSLIERDGRGQRARFRITEAGRNRVASIEPARLWAKPWDRRWRVFGYDLPETRRKDRVALWKALHARKLGLLQRSMWVWPHPVEQLLREIVEAEGIPECFCGFESRQLFLCDDAEVVEAAWDFQEIGRRHQSYLRHPAATAKALATARDLQTLAQRVRVERQAYQFAFSFDPFLPRELWPKSYAGPAVEARHQRFRAALREQLTRLTG